MSAEILGVLSSSQNKDGELDATTSTSILRLAKVAESLKEQQTIYASIQQSPIISGEVSPQMSIVPVKK